MRTNRSLTFAALKTYRLAAVGLLAAAPVFAAQYSFELKPESTSIDITLSALMHTVHGNFHLTRGHIDFDSETGRASGQVIVDTTSGKTGDDSRDSNMHKHVLESMKFPEAIFVPDRVEGKVLVPGSSTVKVHGMLTVHGAAHEMTMDVQTSASADHQMKANMSFDIPYVAWGMKDPSNFLLKVGKTVKMTIDASGIITLK